MVLVLLDPVLELRARSRTIKTLLNLAPSTARHVAEGSDHEVPLDQVEFGDGTATNVAVSIPDSLDTIPHESEAHQSLKVASLDESDD